jgi:hypothetical protein
MLENKFKYRANAKDVVGIAFLNNVLELKTSLGSLDEAVRFHDIEFKARNISPSVYSDQLIIQMFIQHKRFARAMAFKREVESESREVGLHAYGSLVEYCSSHDQLGSALMLVRECIRVHGTPPSDIALKHMRVLLRRARIDDNPEILEMIGKDPDDWAKRGEVLKRNRSKKDRDANRFVRNIMIQT